MAYATVADLAAFLGRPAPGEAARLLERASVTVAHNVRRRVRTDDAGQPIESADKIRDAVCAQVEYWLTTSEYVDIAAWDPAEGDADPPLAPRAGRILDLAGLRNTAVG